MNIFEQIMLDEDFAVLTALDRWNGTHRIRKETVAEHSFLVILFTNLLVEEIYDENQIVEKLQAVQYATFHDAKEMFDFDVNHVLKYNSFNGENIRSELDSYTNHKTAEKFTGDGSTNFLKNLLIADTVSDFNKSIVKIADWLACIFYLTQEIKMGNKELVGKRLLCVRKLNQASIDNFDRFWDDTLDIDEQPRRLIIQELIYAKF